MNEHVRTKHGVGRRCATTVGMAAVVEIVMGLAVQGGAQARTPVPSSDSAPPPIPGWRAICTLTGDDLQLSNPRVTLPGFEDGLIDAHVARATMTIEQNARGQIRTRAHTTAPFDLEMIVERIEDAPIVVRPEVNLGGIVTSHSPGAVRVDRIEPAGRDEGDNATMDIAAGSLTIRRLPFRCEDLALSSAWPKWYLRTNTHLVAGIRRLRATPSDIGYPVETHGELMASVRAGRGDWMEIEHTAPGAFTVRGWARGLKTRELTGGGGSGQAPPKTHACIPGTPTRVELATIDAGTPIHQRSTPPDGGADTVWMSFTTNTRALVAKYPEGRAAIVGITGWRWKDNRCEFGWVETAAAHPVIK